MTSPSALFHFFLGTWSIVRHFDSHGSGKGIAKFTRLTRSLMGYREDLGVQMPGFSEEVYKEYFYAIEEGHICKKFVDKRLFYKLCLTEKAATGSHRCGQDDYEAHYAFVDDSHFSLTYAVNGPQKKYTLVTEFQRL